jgi:hypothetical protein
VLVPNAVAQSMRFHVFDEPLGVNWVIVTAYSRRCS